MLTEQAVQTIIFRALENLNAELDADRKIQVGPQTRLFGADATLDSLSLVSVIVDVEGDVSAASGKPIALTDDRAMSRNISPFTDVRSLTAYIVELLSEAT
jgi:acyl carrier protein